MNKKSFFSKKITDIIVIFLLGIVIIIAMIIVIKPFYNISVKSKTSSFYSKQKTIKNNLDDNNSFLSSDLLTISHEEMVKTKLNRQKYLELLKEENNLINKYQDKFNEYQIWILSQIDELKQNKFLLEQQQEAKQQKIDRLKHFDIKDNKEKISQIQYKVDSIADAIEKVKFNIAISEETQKYYQFVLSVTDKYKRILEKKLKN
ncbi:MAG: hypothetical protein Q8831_02345 ['Bonamia sp.' little leaf phytoplasma]|nr:hypothetical protein ['Bonamia sp.' little leaf phytoplasma]